MAKLNIKTQFNTKMSRRKQQILQFDSMKDGKRNGISNKAWAALKRKEEKARELEEKAEELREERLKQSRKIIRELEVKLTNIHPQYLKDVAWACAVYKCEGLEIILEATQEVWAKVQEIYREPNNEDRSYHYLTVEEGSDKYERTRIFFMNEYSKIKERNELDRINAQAFLGDLMSL